jgi:hypothetical protein
VDFWDFTKLLVRRWWVALPLLVLTFAMTMKTYTTVKPNYTATTYVLLVPPRATPDKPGTLNQAQRNSWLGQGMTALGNAASVSVLDPTVAQELEAAGLSPSITADFNNSSEMATFVIVGKSEAQTTDTATELVRRYQASVKALQDRVGAPPTDQFTAQRLGSTNGTIETNGNVKRAAVAVGGAGLLMTAGLTVAVDVLLRRRPRRRLNAEQMDMPESGPTSVAPAAPASPAGPPAPSAGPRGGGRPSVLGGNNGLVPTYHTVSTGVSSTRASRDFSVSYDDQRGDRSEAGITHAKEAASEEADHAPADSTVVLPLKIWADGKPDSNRRP